MNQSCELASNLQRIRFGTSDKAKLNHKVYYGDIESAHLAGQLTMIDKIKTVLKNNPPANFEELIGDLEIEQMTVYNYSLKYLHGRFKQAKVEDFMKEDSYKGLAK